MADFGEIAGLTPEMGGAGDEEPGFGIDDEDLKIYLASKAAAAATAEGETSAEDSDDPDWQPNRFEELAYLLPGDRVRTTGKTFIDTGIKECADVDSRSIPRGMEATVVRNGGLGFMYVSLDTSMMVSHHNICLVRLNYAILQIIEPTRWAVRRPDAPGEYVVLKPVRVLEDLKTTAEQPPDTPVAEKKKKKKEKKEKKGDEGKSEKPPQEEPQAEVMEDQPGELLGTFGGHIATYDTRRGFGFIESPELRDITGAQGFARIAALGKYNVGDTVSFTAYANLRGGSPICVDLKDEGPMWICRVCGRDNEEIRFMCRVCHTRRKYEFRQEQRVLTETLNEMDRVRIVALEDSSRRLRGRLASDDGVVRWIVLIDREQGVRMAMPVENSPPVEFKAPTRRLA